LREVNLGHFPIVAAQLRKCTGCPLHRKSLFDEGHELRQHGLRQGTLHHNRPSRHVRAMPRIGCTAQGERQQLALVRRREEERWLGEIAERRQQRNYFRQEL